MASLTSTSSVGSPLAEDGARDKVSAVYMCFPGMWTMEESNRARRRRKRSNQGGRLSRCFEPSRGTSGL